MKQWLLLFIIVAWGCSSKKMDQLPIRVQKLKNLTVYPENTKAQETISFKKDVVYGEPKKDLIGRIGDVAVDSSGRVYIADTQVQIIYIFEPDGQYLAQLGREGRGPGEFGSIRKLQIRNNRLYAFDFKQQKVNVFTLDTLADKKTVILAENRGKYKALQRAYPWIDELYVKNNDTYIAKFKSDSSKKDIIWQNFDIRGLFYPLDSTGKISSGKLLDFKVATGTQVGRPSSDVLFAYHLRSFFGSVLPLLSSDNHIYLAGPDHFLVKVYSPNGVYQYAFYYPHENIPLTRKSAIEVGVRDVYIRNMNAMDLPETWPVLAAMKIDDQSRLWVATTVEDMNTYEWWVLEETGELITKFEWPRDTPIEIIRNGYMYTRDTDEETGLQRIVRYRIEMR